MCGEGEKLFPPSIECFHTFPLEKGDEGAISGIGRLQEYILWAGLLPGYIAAFQFLIFSVSGDPCLSAFIRIPIKFLVAVSPRCGG
jgi:hypothetical protein